MKKNIILLGLLGLVGCHADKIATASCELKNIPVMSTDPSRNELYVATGVTTAVQFHNENAPQPAEIFPDPRVTVKNLRTGDSCDIKDGNGIWSGKSVYLDAAGQVLVLNEYSGANDALIFYDPRTCQKLTELDVSNKRWKISNDRIHIGQHCNGENVDTCRSIQVSMLNKRCLAEQPQNITSK